MFSGGGEGDLADSGCVMDDKAYQKVLIDDYRERVIKACRIALDIGQVDGAHHKMWVIDQMLRALLRDSYNNAITDDWDKGIAP